MIRNTLAATKPWVISIVLFILCAGLRVTDSFILRLDERWGEIILSKSLGFGLILIYLFLAGFGVRELGLRKWK